MDAGLLSLARFDGDPTKTAQVLDVDPESLMALKARGKSTA